MAGFFGSRALTTGAMLGGFGLMNVAMFLHPMSPEDFLGLILSDPIQTVFDSQGGAAAIFFWLGLLLSLAGVFGLLTYLIRVTRNAIHAAHLQHAMSH